MLIYSAKSDKVFSVKTLPKSHKECPEIRGLVEFSIQYAYRRFKLSRSQDFSDRLSYIVLKKSRSDGACNSARRYDEEMSEQQAHLKRLL